ncbi:hypothetical protein K491DRAFT_674330 [Lophiostoma macrostomum CBS 122681]|uniref:Cytidyltransferase-like domain-containing protein n=1 Tax=Lophiostoma macrostomum CBS 122681 TaxID=1314788 RepID=A0A6A6TMQ9_9PLEO|nr:hypothetical protein K491DRAFT_674330 [Lophiostoma macrostomum CBS 122681]
MALEEAEDNFARTKGPVPSAFEDFTFDARWWTGPTNKIQTRLGQVSDDDQELAVIVTTGAFCPIHRGHVQMLETAKKELESRGIAVLGGYICPDHDRYVSTKIKVGSLSAAERLELCEIAAEASDWIMVDRWAAIYAWSAVGFTTIVSHIEKMVNHYVKTPRPINVVYAFGGDNAAFSFSFVAGGSCVCVLRPGSLEVFQEMHGYESFRNNPMIIFSHDTTAPLDSTSVRKGDLAALLPKVKNRWITMTTGTPPKLLSSAPSHTKVYHIRNEGLWALQPFLPQSKCSIEMLERAYDMFCENLQEVFELAFDAVAGQIPSFKISRTRLRDQENPFQELHTTHSPILSLDPCLPGTNNLYISQLSEPLVQAPLAVVAAPGTASLEKQFAQLEAGEYALFAEHLPLEPKILEYLEGKLPEGRTIASQICHEHLSTPSRGGQSVDTSTRTQRTINARDFLAGSQQGGTLLQLPSSVTRVVRAPNMLPYIRACEVASIAEMGFSKAVWELNQQFFTSVGGEATVSDTDLGFQALCELQGFPPDMRMTEICQWHLDAFDDMSFKELWIGL